MIEQWIDTLARVWGEIQAPGFRSVRSYRMVEVAEFPEAINPSDDFPVALTIPGQLAVEYSAGGPKIGFWRGVTEFHLTPDLNKAHMPRLLPFYGLIWQAAASHVRLGGLVELFLIDSREDGINGPMAMQYGNEAPHWGFLVNWWVKEKVDATLTVTA